MISLLALLALQPVDADLDAKASRETLSQFAQCVVKKDRATVHQNLTRDFNSDSYKVSMRRLATEASECLVGGDRRDASRMGTSTLPLAGAMAEVLIEEAETPLLSRLASAAIGPEAQTYSAPDAMAMCAVRGAPDLVAVMFDSDVESEAEQAAYERLLPIVNACWQGERQLSVSPFGLRSMLATASYRLLDAQENSGGDDA